MYEELVERLRSHNGWALNETLDEAADAIEELQAAVDGLTSQTNMVLEETEGRTVIKFEPKWIPVTERLPEINIAVLVYAPKYRNTFMAYLTDDGWKTWAARNDGYDWPPEHEITHWMPSPEPPKEGE